eukprot:scaffold1445_cov235-Pinguiococcus_pyrenoidosus.AAC.9
MDFPSDDLVGLPGEGGATLGAEHLVTSLRFVDQDLALRTWARARLDKLYTLHGSRVTSVIILAFAKTVLTEMRAALRTKVIPIEEPIARRRRWTTVNVSRRGRAVQHLATFQVLQENLARVGEIPSERHTTGFVPRDF